jgi:hypothetical protein
MERLDGPGIAEMTSIWAERCAPSPAGSELGEYATAAEARGSWTARVETRDARRLHMAVAPLPDASTLVVFRDALAPGRDPLFDDLALEQIRLPVEAAVRDVTAAIASARTPEAFQALAATAQGLRDGLERSRVLAALPQDAASGAASGPLSALAAALAARGLALAVTGAEAAIADPALRRAVLALGLAGADLAAAGATVEITLGASPDGRRVTLAAPAGAPASQVEGLGVALARRVVETAGGRLRVEPSDGRLVLVADLPPTVAPDLPLPATRLALGA